MVRSLESDTSFIMSSIIIDRLTADGGTLECSIRSTADLERFFTDESFRTEYDVSIEDVPDGVLAIPVLAQICPVAWANGADVYVDEVDATFAQALEDVKTSLCEMHDFLEGGTLYARWTIDPEPEPSDESGLLFTGGVDSTCSYVRHREESPTLVSIRGWTITPNSADDGKWDALRTRVSRFADDHDCETAFVESNMLSFLDHPMLLAHYKRHVDGGWYSSVGHGLGLLGLCAPMAYARGMTTLYVAATHWDGIDLEWGSRPDIDDHVRWTGTQCHHDGYELTARNVSTASPTTSATRSRHCNSRPVTIRWTATAVSVKSATALPSGFVSRASSRPIMAIRSPTRTTVGSGAPSSAVTGCSVRMSATCGRISASALGRQNPPRRPSRPSSSGSRASTWTT